MQGRGLSKAATTAIETADTVLISPVSCWELTLLAERGRIELDRPATDWTRDLLRQPGVAEAPLTWPAASDAALLPAAGFDGDPADCLIYATARLHGAPLVTKDRRLRDHARRAGDVRCVW